MPSQIVSSVENNFTKGLITESTGLNFPENAATDCDNVKFEIIGDVTRRLGIDFEHHYQNLAASTASKAHSSYVWNNPGGDSVARIFARQLGNVIFFYSIDQVTVINPLSANFITSINIDYYAVTTFDSTLECTYSDGHGYLFIYHPNCNPVYMTYSSGVLISNLITVQIRDFIGVPDGFQTTDRPSSLSSEHQYNLVNQGWTSGNPWSGFSVTSVVAGNGSKIFTIATGIAGINPGDYVYVKNNHTALVGSGRIYSPAGTIVMAGTVSSYTSGTGQLVLNVTSTNSDWAGFNYNDWYITPLNYGKISTWHTAIGNYPSNSDVWWLFKNNSNVFDPATTIGNVTVNTGNAPKGHIFFNAFNQDRSAITGIAGISPVTTNLRPSNGAWFQGRVWYTGVNANQAATGNTSFYSWSENIYFSCIVNTERDFGQCYQQNDPTSEDLNGLLPTDGGVITISGSGIIYKLFPIANGLLVFATNGVWFITGSKGIGFSADDYTITQISKIKIISNKSFVDVNGLPYFWNEEGIYQVIPNQSGQLTVEPLTVGTILSYYNQIPLDSKLYARGSYDPINYQIQWLFKGTNEVDITDRYSFDKILNFNTYNKAFFPYSISPGTAGEKISTINYITYPKSTNVPEPTFKYGSSTPSNIQFAEEYQTTFKDWNSLSSGVDYKSYFVTGYKLHGQGQRRFQIPYIYVFNRNSEEFDKLAYSISGVWDYATSGNSGRWSTLETVVLDDSNFGMLFKRHKIRGRGITLQFKVQSVPGYSFDIMGWSVYENVNQGV